MKNINDLLQFALDNSGKTFFLGINQDSKVFVEANGEVLQTEISSDEMPNLNEVHLIDYNTHETIIKFDGRSVGDVGYIRHRIKNELL
jgi:hypothetical protein